MGGVVLYFAITLGLMLVLGGLAVFAANGLVAAPLPPLALLTLAGLGPTLAGIIASAHEAGSAGVRALLAQVVRWRVGLRWYALAVLGPALVVCLAALIGLAVSGFLPPVPPGVWQTLPILAVVYLVLATIEEVGWRGYAQPRLQRRMGFLWAALLVGALWAIWHLPQWWIPETGQAAKWSFGVFAAGTVAQSVALAWLYNGARTSVLVAAIAHASINLAPEPWAAAWQQLPESVRGPYPSVLIALAWVAVVLVLVLAGAARTHGGRVRAGL
jgi:membrane protease YdiL (CAAX protease family)